MSKLNRFQTTAKRFEALEVRDAINRLLDVEKFSKFVENMYKDTKRTDSEWIDVCNEAYIDEDMRDWMYTVLFERSIKDAHLEQTNGFCWDP